MKRAGMDALFGLLLLLALVSSSEAVLRGPHQLWRLLESQSSKRGRRELLDTVGANQQDVEGEQRDLKISRSSRLPTSKIDVATCKRYCQRNRDDMVGYKCSVSLGAMVEECCQALRNVYT